MDAAQIVTLVATAVGSLTGSYFMASRAARRRIDSSPPPRQTFDVGPIWIKIEALERELHTEVRSMEAKVAALSGEVLTVEEFQAYTTLDGERRERLIARISELQGTIAAVLPHMRR